MAGYNREYADSWCWWSLCRTHIFGGFSVFLVMIHVSSFPVETAPVQSALSAMAYLTRYGYIESTSSKQGNLITEQSFTDAIKEFQRFVGLNQTGILDEETLTMMNSPRCGVKDIVGHSITARRKRYALQGSRWRVKQLSYKISRYPSRLSKDEVDDEIRRSFQIWSDNTDLTFSQKTTGRVHIEIRFEKGEHGDGDPFDGPGGTLAHAYFPIYGGDAHFDDAERWTVKSYRGTNLFQVAAHEFGHSLGLSHSDVKESLMAPVYRGYSSNLRLHADDVSGIQALYGANSKTRPKPLPPTKPTDGGVSPNPDEGHEEGELCTDSSIDAIFTVDQKTYAFKGDYYWRLTDVGLADGYPRKISNDWERLPINIDAAFTWRNGKTYFFKGDSYYRYDGMKLDPGYPQLIKEGFPGIPNNVDAAFVWSGNGKIYFFKGSKYWRFDPDQLPPVSDEYPKAVSSWEGIPDNINAAFQWTNGYTYFFKGTYYWRFNDRLFQVDSSKPPFPRSSAIWWFGCKSLSADDDPMAGISLANTPAAHGHVTDGDDEADVQVDGVEDAALHQPNQQFPEQAIPSGAAAPYIWIKAAPFLISALLHCILL